MTLKLLKKARKVSPEPEQIAEMYARLRETSNRRHVMHVIEDHLAEEAQDAVDGARKGPQGESGR
jgi:hypothetical protein